MNYQAGKPNLVGMVGGDAEIETSTGHLLLDLDFSSTSSKVLVPGLGKGPRAPPEAPRRVEKERC